MNLSRLSFIAIAAALFGAVQGNAQSLRDAPTPAEFPASSYQGRQYVDSRGCVFIRAGVGANVTWVPRITRDRKALCGFQPSVAKAAPAAAPAAKPAPAEVAAIAAAVTTPPVVLSPADIAALVAFLDSLTDPVAITGRLGVPDAVPSGLPVPR